MCRREPILPLRPSLGTYTAKEFVYVIIFSLTASLRAAGFWRWEDEEGALLQTQQCPQAWCKLSVLTTPPPALPTPAWALTYSGGIPGAPPAPQGRGCVLLHQ